MERPPQHVTDSLGESQMKSIFEPLGWVVNKLPNDYGIDFEVEVFENYRSTGASFKIQLKSSVATKYSTSGKFISQRMSRKNVERICHEMRTPVFLIHADVKKQKTFWLAPRLDSAVIQKLTLTGKPRGTIMVQIPCANALPETLGDFVEAITQMQNVVAAQVIVATTVPDFVKFVHRQFPAAQLIRTFQDKKDGVKLEQAQKMLRERKYKEALTWVESIINDPDASVDSKFFAIVGVERVQDTILIRAMAPSVERARLHTETARRLQQLARKGFPHLKFFALIARKAAELGDLIERDYSLYLNSKSTGEATNPFWRLRLASLRVGVYSQIADRYNHCMRLVRYAANSSYRWALPDALLRIARTTALLIARLRFEEMREAAELYSASALQICRLAVWIAFETHDERPLSSAVSAALTTAWTANDPQVQWARETIGLIKDLQIRDDAEYLFEANMRRIRGQPVEQGIGEEEFPRQIIQNMAAARGIDLSDPNDPAAKLVKIGIADLDPSRVVRNCDRIFISLAPRPPLSLTMYITETLGLPSAGPKIIHCDLHDHALDGPTLDEAYQGFKDKFCATCPDCRPRSAEWNYSEEWQGEENKRHTEFLRQFNQRMGWPGPRE